MDEAIQQNSSSNIGKKIIIGCAMIAILGIIVFLVVLLLGGSYAIKKANEVNKVIREVTEDAFKEKAEVDEMAREIKEDPIKKAKEIGEDANQQAEELKLKAYNYETEIFTHPLPMNSAIPFENTDTEWKVTKAQDLGNTIKSKIPYADDCKSESGKFIRIEASIKNIGNKSITFRQKPTLYDSDKNEYTEESHRLFACIDTQESIRPGNIINPGLARTFIGVYEVPESATGFKVKVVGQSDDYYSLGDFAFVEVEL